jgi:ribose transport system substrate-binding protein
MRILAVAFSLLLGSSALAQTIGLSVSTLNNPFFVTLRDGAQAMADQLGMQPLVTDAQDSVSTQISDIEDLVQRGIDVLIVNPTDSDAVVPAVAAAMEAGIPVIAVDRGVSTEGLAYFIASDNVAGGSAAASFICDLLAGSGPVVELEGIPGVSATRERGLGFNTFMVEDCPDVEIVARQTANFNRAEGLTVMENILTAQPDIRAVFAHNDEMALGALQAI